MNFFSPPRWQRLCAYVCLLFGLCLVAGCTAGEQPEPEQTQEERRLQEKEILQREMRNE